MYSFKFFKHKTISKLWFKLILTLALIFLLGLLSQPFHMFLSSYFVEESKMLTYRGFSYRAYEFILGYLNTALNLSNNQIFIILNLCITIFVILNFVYIASTKIKELFFLNLPCILVEPQEYLLNHPSFENFLTQLLNTCQLLSRNHLAYVQKDF